MQGLLSGGVGAPVTIRAVECFPRAIHNGSTAPLVSLRQQSSELIYVGHFEGGLQRARATSDEPTRHVLLDAESVDFIDTSACDALLGLAKRLHSEGVTLGFARVRDSVREQLRSAGIEAVVGSISF